MHHCDGSFARTNLENVSTCFVGKYTSQHVGSRHFRVFCRSQPPREPRPADCCVARASPQTRHFLIRQVKIHSSKPGSDKYRSRQELSTSVSSDMVLLTSFAFSNSICRPQNVSKRCGLALRTQYKSFPKHYETINFCQTSRGFPGSKISLKMKFYETELSFHVQVSSNKPFLYQWLTAFVPNLESLYFYSIHALFTDGHRIFI